MASIADLSEVLHYEGATRYDDFGDCILPVGTRVMLASTTLYGQVIATHDADYDHDGDRFFQCAWVAVDVAWDDGITDRHGLTELILAEPALPENNADLSPLWSGVSIEGPRC
jgi:hypothetical protein